ncbi:MAG: O-methyltransferase [Bacilli bacterium]
MDNYFYNLNELPNSKTIKEMGHYAKLNKIPILNDQGLALIIQLASLIKPKRFLEIGTAIAFTSINMATFSDEVIVDTIEKNEEMYQLALKNVADAKLNGRVNIYLGDALEFDTSQINNRYDMIFIDAAKAQYIHFFEKYSPLLADEGVIISDNLLFHGLVTQEAPIENKNLKNLVEKIKNYNTWLAKNKKFQTIFLEIGDGMAISSRTNK